MLNRIRSVALLLLAGAALPVAGAQDLIYQLAPPVLPASGVAEVIPLADVNGDGHDDFTVGGTSGSVALALISGRNGEAIEQVPLGLELPLMIIDLDGDGLMEFVSTTSFYASGDVIIRSGGPSGAVIVKIPAPADSVSFASDVTVLGDLNGDGVLDLAISAPSDTAVVHGQPIGGLGRLYVHSGGDGEPLFEVVSPVLPQVFDLLFSTSVAALSDVTGDGIPDLSVGSKGRAFVLSGADGSLVHQLGDVDFNGLFGSVVARAGDVDGDGVDDVIVGAPQTWLESPPGYVHVFSGRTGDLVLALAGETGDFFGAAATAIDDLDGDGTVDLLVGAPQRLNEVFFGGPGFVRAFSGRDGATLFTRHGDVGGGGFGGGVADVGDVNGDGAPDFTVSHSDVAASMFHAPLVRVYSSRDLALTTDVHRVVLSAGGAQSLRLDVGPDHAGRPYFVLGSASGIDPGVSALGQFLPLNPDAWLFYTASHPNQGPLSNTFGTLDANGRAQAAIAVMPLAAPALIGLTLDHAFLVLDGAAAAAASHAVPLTLVGG